MNISQHCFMPRTKTLPGYYLLSGSYSNVSSVNTTEKQTGDVYNCFQLFGVNVPKDYYVLRVYEPTTTTQLVNNGIGVNSSSSYVSPILVKTSNIYTSSAFTFGSTSYPKGLKVLSVMWLEDNPSLSMLSTVNSINSINNQEEFI